MSCKCEICGLGPPNDPTVFRANPKGVTGIWRCAKHHCAESFATASDPCINAIEEALNPKKESIN